MKKYLLLVGTALLAANLLMACSSDVVVQQADNDTAANIKEQKNHAKRVVALTPLAADLIYHLDKSLLVAVPSSRYIQEVANERFADFTKVGTRGNINLEQIVLLQPDLVIGSGTFQDEVLNKLGEIGINTISHETRSWQDLENLTMQLAEKTGTNPEPILSRLQSFLADIPEHNTSVLFLVSTQPTLSPNKNSWAGNLLQKFNYQNVTAELESSGRFQGYLTLSQEKILANNPDKIFIMESTTVNPEVFRQLPFWNKLRASQNNQVYVFHHDGLVSPTSIDTVEAVTRKLREVASK